MQGGLEIAICRWDVSAARGMVANLEPAEMGHREGQGRSEILRWREMLLRRRSREARPCWEGG